MNVVSPNILCKVLLLLQMLIVITITTKLRDIIYDWVYRSRVVINVPFIVFAYESICSNNILFFLSKFNIRARIIRSTYILLD